MVKPINSRIPRKDDAEHSVEIDEVCSSSNC